MTKHMTEDRDSLDELSEYIDSKIATAIDKNSANDS